MFMTPLEAQNRNPSCKTKKIKLVAKTKTFQRNGKKKITVGQVQISISRSDMQRKSKFDQSELWILGLKGSHWSET